MRRPTRAVLAVCAAAFVLAVPFAASADETDNFTCRARLSRDSLAILDSWVNAQIQEIARAREQARFGTARRSDPRSGTAEGDRRELTRPLHARPSLAIREMDRRAASDRPVPPELRGHHLRRPPLQPAVAVSVPGPDGPGRRLDSALGPRRRPGQDQPLHPGGARQLARGQRAG